MAKKIVVAEKIKKGIFTPSEYEVSFDFSKENRTITKDYVIELLTKAMVTPEEVIILNVVGGKFERGIFAGLGKVTNKELKKTNDYNFFNNLYEVNLFDVKEISEYMFANTKLEVLTCDDSLKSVNAFAFDNCLDFRRHNFFINYEFGRQNVFQKNKKDIFVEPTAFATKEDLKFAYEHEFGEKGIEIL